MTDTHRRDDGPDAATPSPGAEPGTDAPAEPDAEAPAMADAAAGARAPAGAARRPAGRSDGDYETGGLRLALLVGAVVALGVLGGWPVVLVVLGLVTMIFLHELGHFVTAKWAGMKVTEFFIGFGPRIWSFRRGETEYGIKVLPAGAYVRIIGMNNLDEADPADEPRTYRQQSFPKRLLVVSAGSIMHFLQAWLILVILLGVVGLPGGSLFDRDESAWVVGSVSDDSAASRAGLEPDDQVVAFNGEPVDTFDELTSRIRRADVGDEVTLTVVRDGESFDVSTEIGARPDGVSGGTAGAPFLGVGQSYPEETLGPVETLGHATTETAHMMREATGALVGFFSPNGLSDFADNVGRGGDEPAAQPSSGGASDDEGNRMLSILGVVRLGASAAEEDGLIQLLFIFFQINIFIGILNMVPLPPLDGGHAAVAIYERIRSRRGRRYHADVAKLLPLTYAVVMGLVVLGVTSLYLDVVSPIDL